MRNLHTYITLPLALLLVFGLTGCDHLSGLLTGNQPAESGEVLFMDDFADNRNNWGTMGRTGGEISLAYDGLVIGVDVANFLFWSVSGERLTDTQIDVDAVLLEGPVNDHFGVLCRYADNDHFYGFLVTHDGYYGIFKMMEGEITLLSGEGSMQYSDMIRQGGTVNHLSAVCADNSLSLSVNDQLLAEVQDASFQSGQVGLAAGTYQEHGVKVFFDNLVIRQP